MANKENLQADIVVIGGGGAGIPAAVAAVEAGVNNVIVLEARRAPGGNAGGLASIFAIGSRIQRRLTINTNSDDFFKIAMSYAHWKTNPRLIRVLLDKTGDTIDWLESKGVKFTGVIPHYPNQHPPVYHTTEQPILKTLRKNCTDLGVPVLCQTQAKKLLTDKKGKMTGVLAISGGKELNISTKSVIIATGGFAGDRELLQQYIPWYNPDEMADEKEDMGIRHKGTGVRLVAEIGAAVDDTVAIALGGPRAILPASIAMFAGKPNTLWVNKNGERFADETVGFLFPEGANALNRQPGKICYTLFDEDIKQSIIKAGPDAFALSHMKREVWPPSGMDKDFPAQADKGKVKISDSWADIARWIGAKPGVLQLTVDEYNSFCDHGHDDLFAKERCYLMPLRTPPYYALPGGIGVTTTHGPIRVNTDMAVLNQHGVPIGGLYAAGVDIGGVDADTYNLHLSGHSFGFSVSSGRIAGENAARYVTGVNRQAK
jgi:fumarate reductase flavoprotein subunit